MSSTLQVMMLIRVLTEVLGLIVRAREAGTGISKEQIDAAFDKVETADAAWAEANRPKTEGD